MFVPIWANLVLRILFPSLLRLSYWSVVGRFEEAILPTGTTLRRGLGRLCAYRIETIACSQKHDGICGIGMYSFAVRGPTRFG